MNLENPSDLFSSARHSFCMMCVELSPKPSDQTRLSLIAFCQPYLLSAVKSVLCPSSPNTHWRNIATARFQTGQNRQFLERDIKLPATNPSLSLPEPYVSITVKPCLGLLLPLTQERESWINLGWSSRIYLSLKCNLSQILSQSHGSDCSLKSKLRLKYFRELQHLSTQKSWSGVLWAVYWAATVIMTVIFHLTDITSR